MKTLGLFISIVLSTYSFSAQAAVTNVSSSAYSGPVLLGEESAVWGLGQNTSLTPIPGSYSGVQLTNVNPNNLPLRALGQFQVPDYQFVNVSGTFYGGIQHDGQGFPYGWNDGTGFELAFTPDAETTYEVYLLSYLGVSNAVIYLGDEYQEEVFLPSGTPTKVTFTTDSYTRLVAVMESADIDHSDANLSVGAVNVVAVAEPTYNYCLLTGFCLTPMFCYWSRRKKRESKNQSPSGAGE
jgi:hypothetical protein